VALLDKNGNIEGVTIFYDIDGAVYPATGWTVSGNKFVIYLESTEVTFTEQAVYNILNAIRTSPEYHVEA